MKNLTNDQIVELAKADTRTFVKPDSTNQEITGFVRITADQYNLTGITRNIFLSWANEELNLTY